MLSDKTVGINMQGRRNGEFYSEIIAWDNTKYFYVGLKPNDDKTKLVPCSRSTTVPFCFATLEPLNESNRLHDVPTLNNADHGITMKMINFGISDGKRYGEAASATVTNDFFGGSTGRKTGLLSNRLSENGYPDVEVAGKKNLGEAYADAFYVNNLFLERVYNSSGYFEFDSCQNYATLCKKDSYIYTLSVPNTKADTEFALLTIEKQVSGAFGNKEREFTFTVEITDAGDGDAFVRAKNGEEQTAMPGTGTTFTMKHNDRVEISLPAGVGVTVTEDNEEYTASMKLDSQESIEGNTISFTFSGSDVLTVTNILDGTVPSGLSSNIRTALALIALPLLPVGCILYCKRRRRKTAV